MNALVTVVLSSNQFSQLPLTRLVPAVSSFISLIYEFPRTRANLDLMGRLLTTAGERWMKRLVSRSKKKSRHATTRPHPRVDELTSVVHFSGHGPWDLRSRGYTPVYYAYAAASERRRRQVRSARINLGAWRRQQVLGSRFDAPASRTSSFFSSYFYCYSFALFFPPFSLLPVYSFK